MICLWKTVFFAQRQFRKLSKCEAKFLYDFGILIDFWKILLSSSGACFLFENHYLVWVQNKITKWSKTNKNSVTWNQFKLKKEEPITEFYFLFHTKMEKIAHFEIKQQHEQKSMKKNRKILCVCEISRLVGSRKPQNIFKFYLFLFIFFFSNSTELFDSWKNFWF